MELTAPVSASHDGWTAESASSNQPTADEMRQALGGDPPTAEEAAATAAAAVAEAATATAKAAETDRLAAEVAAEGGDGTVAEGELDATVASAAAVAAPKQRKAQDRIDQAIGRQRQAEDALLVEKTKREDLERRLLALETGRPAEGAIAKPAAVADPAAVVAAAAVPAEPTWEEFEAEGKSWAEYTKAHTAWVTTTVTAAAVKAADDRVAAARTQDTATRQTETQRALQQQAEQKHRERLDAMRVKRPDFDTLVKTHLDDVHSPLIDHLVLGTDVGVDLMLHLAEHPDEAHAIADLEHAVVSAGRQQALVPIVRAIRGSDVVVKLLSYLGTHPDEFQAMTVMDPFMAVKQLGRLEAQLATPLSGSPSVVPAVTRAKPPLRPVVGAAHVASPTGTSSDDLAFGPEWVAQENRKEAAARRAR